jgi:hypothetical protein
LLAAAAALMRLETLTVKALGETEQHLLFLVLLLHTPAAAAVVDIQLSGPLEVMVAAVPVGKHLAVPEWPAALILVAAEAAQPEPAVVVDYFLAAQAALA